MDRNYKVIIIFQNTFILRRPRVANFAEIIKVSTMFIKTTFKDSKKLKELEIFLKIMKKRSISVFLDVTTGEKMLMSAECKECAT